MKRENLELRASYARLLGWVAIGLGVLSTWPWLASWLFHSQGIGKAFAIGLYAAFAMPVVALVAVLINPRALESRSAVPLFSLILGLIVAAAFGYILAMLAGLGRMH